jgi:hypothetical protein
MADFILHSRQRICNRWVQARKRWAQADCGIIAGKIGGWDVNEENKC